MVAAVPAAAVKSRRGIHRDGSSQLRAVNRAYSPVGKAALLVLVAAIGFGAIIAFRLIAYVAARGEMPMFHGFFG